MHGKQSTDGDRAAQERARSLIDKVISDRYRIRELIAMGGMGAVYRAEHLLLKKRIAIKILHPETENLPELVKRFEREAIAGAHIQHPNVATATDFGKLSDGSYFLCLEYVKGRTLHQILQDGPLSPRRAARLTRQLASALDAIHRLDIVHRDLKPRNIMVVEGKTDTVKIIDLGLAKVKVNELSDRQAEDHRPGSMYDDDDGGGLTIAGTIFGTIAYLSPEAAEGMDAVDARSDLYALGLMFYEMLSGKHPFTAVNPVELFMQHRFEPPPPIAKRNPDVTVPESLEAIARKLLEKQPAMRYQTGAEVAAALDEVLKELGPGEEGAAGDEEPGSDVVDSMRGSIHSVRPPPVTQSQRPPPVAPATPATPAPPSVKPAVDDGGSARASRAAPPNPATETPKPAPPPSKPAATETPKAAPPATKSKPKRAPDPARPFKMDFDEDDAPAAKGGADALLVPTGRKKKGLSALTIVITVVAGLAVGYGAHLARSMSKRNAEVAPPAAQTTAPTAKAEPPKPSAAAAPQPPTAIPAALSSSTAAASTPAAHLSEDEVKSLRRKFKDAFRFRDWRGANRIALDLGKGAPEVYKDSEFVSYAQSLAITLSKENAEGELMKLFADDLGTDGLDILYAFIEGQGKAPIAVTAAKLLEDESRLAKASPAMRIALELRNASCVDKLKLLDRAGKEGDARARLALETLGKSCFPNNADVDRVIFDLRTRFPKR